MTDRTRQSIGGMDVSSMRGLTIFAAGCAITAAAWAIFWPRPVPVSPPPAEAVVVVPEVRWTKERISSLIIDLENAKTDEARLEASSKLLQIPLEAASEALETVNLKNDRGLSLVAKVLLIRWASGDGESATNWAWKRFRSEGLWEAAFREIGPAWAAHNPVGLGKWALEVAEKTKSPAETITMSEAIAADEPLLDSSALGDISEWLMTEDPHLAYQVLFKRGSISTEDAKVPLALTSVAKVRQALLAFQRLDKLSDATLMGNEDYQAVHLFTRWRDLDPEDFSRSPYTSFVFPDPTKETAAALEEWKSSPGAETASRLVASAGANQFNRISEIARTWAETDPAATVNWLDSLPAENAFAARKARISILAATDLDATLDWADTLPRETRSSALVSAFDAWRKAHPGQRPVMSDWSETRRRAWADLEALPASGVVSSGG
jgi:hypothetical protein